MSALAFAVLIGLVPLTIFYGRTIAPWIIPGLTVGLLGFGMARGVRVYEAFVEGARDGFAVAVRIIPYLVAILFVIKVFMASGAFEDMKLIASWVMERIGLGEYTESLDLNGCYRCSGDAKLNAKPVAHVGHHGADQRAVHHQGHHDFAFPIHRQSRIKPSK